MNLEKFKFLPKITKLSEKPMMKYRARCRGDGRRGYGGIYESR